MSAVCVFCHTEGEKALFIPEVSTAKKGAAFRSTLT